jgi:hypothetical protein
MLAPQPNVDFLLGIPMPGSLVANRFGSHRQVSWSDSSRMVSKPSLTGIMEGLLVVRKLHTSTLSENVSNKFVGVSANGPTVHYVRYDTL